MVAVWARMPCVHQGDISKGLVMTVGQKPFIHRNSVIGHGCRGPACPVYIEVG